MTINFDDYPPESERLRHMQETQGGDSAFDFATQTMTAYRRHVLGDKCRGNDRRKFIESYLAFKQFRRDYIRGN